MNKITCYHVVIIKIYWKLAPCFFFLSHIDNSLQDGALLLFSECKRMRILCTFETKTKSQMPEKEYFVELFLFTSELRFYYITLLYTKNRDENIA